MLLLHEKSISVGVVTFFMCKAKPVISDASLNFSQINSLSTKLQKQRQPDHLAYVVV